MTDPRVHRIGAAEVRIYPDWMETRYVLTVPAAGNDDAESHARALSLGYRGDITVHGFEADTWTMSLHHELLHSLIAEQRGQSYSRVLFGVAYRSIGGCKEQIVSPLTSWQEEALVLSVQKYVRLGVVDVLLEASGLDLDVLAARLRELTEQES